MTTDTAVVTSDRLSIKVQPVGGAITDAVHTLTLTTAGTGGKSPYSYQWYKASGVISGATGASCKVKEAGSYYCIITDAGGNRATTDTAQVTDERLTITQQPVGGLYGKTTLSVSATGGKPPYYYFWYDDVNFDLYEPYCTDRQFTPKFSVGKGYYCIVRDSNGTEVASDIAYVHRELWIGQPKCNSHTVGREISIYVEEGLKPYSYQWYKKGSGPIRGATGSTYVPTALGDYYCEITDAEGTKLTSDSISIIYEEFKVTKQPVGGEMGVVLSVAASGGKAPYSYDWYVGEYSVSEYSDTLQTNDHKISGGFYCKVRDANHLVIESDVARVYFPLKIWKQPVDRYVKVTGYTTLDIRTSGGLSPVTCQWQKWAGGVWRNFNIGESVRVEGTQLGTYRCVVTDQSGAELISNTVTVAEDVLRIEKFELSSVSSINPQYIDFYVTGGSYQNSAVKVWLRNKSGKWSELTDLRKEEKTDSIYYTYKITDNDDKWVGNWVVILAKDHAHGLLLRRGRGRDAPRGRGRALRGGVGGPGGHPQPGRRLLPHRRDDRILPRARQRRLLVKSMQASI